MPRVQFANPAGIRVTDDEFEKVFTTYSNYLANVSNLLAGTYGVGADLHGGLVAAMRLLPQVQKIQRNKINKAEHSSIVSAMKLSWCHETQLRLRGKHDPELLPDLLHGSASEAYYAAYHAARAVFTAGNFSAKDNHTSGLNTLSTLVTQRKLLPPPWSVHCTMGPEKDDFVCGGVPAGAPPLLPVHNLAVPDPFTAWSSLDQALRTTRSKVLAERKAEWRTKNSKARVPRAEAQRMARELPATTIFNFLWRLRKRSDYRDADVFVKGIWTPYQAREYHEALTTLIAGTVTVLNSITVAYVGTDVVNEAAKAFLRRPDVYDAVPPRVASLCR